MREVVSYGLEQESAAAALAQLLRARGVGLTKDEGPAGEHLDRDLTNARDQLRTALLDRMTLLGSGRGEDRDLKPDLERIGNQGLHLLHRLVRETPALPAEDPGQAPSDVLGMPHQSPVVTLWREAARSLMIGTHDLARNPHPVWPATPTRPRSASSAAHWYLLHDAAVSIEAFVVLDDRLEAAGLLANHQHGAQAWNLRARRALASTVAREASWAGTDYSPDLAHAATPGGPAAGAVRVTNFDSLGVGENRLATLLTPGHRGRDLDFDPRRELGIGMTKTLLARQAELNFNLAEVCRSQPQISTLAESFHRRATQLLNVRGHLTSLVDVVEHIPPPGLAYQFTELVRAGQTLPQWGTMPAHLADSVNAAHHNAARQLAKAVRRNSSGPRSIYARSLDSGQLAPISTSASSHGPLVQACQTLINAPSRAEGRWANPVMRQALKEQLDRSPTRVRGPLRRLDRGPGDSLERP